jgi:hypothetical protein
MTTTPDVSICAGGLMYRYGPPLVVEIVFEALGPELEPSDLLSKVQTLFHRRPLEAARDTHTYTHTYIQ